MGSLLNAMAIPLCEPLQTACFVVQLFESNPGFVKNGVTSPDFKRIAELLHESHAIAQRTSRTRVRLYCHFAPLLQFKVALTVLPAAFKNDATTAPLPP